MPPANPLPIELEETSTNWPSIKLLTEILLPTLYWSESAVKNSLENLKEPKLFFFKKPLKGLLVFFVKPNEILTDL